MKTKLTKTQKAIYKQLSENTGRALCDSGDIYGRNYEKFKTIPDFNQGLIVESDSVKIPVHVFMSNNFERSDKALVIEKTLIKELKRMKVDYPTLCYSNQDEIAEILENCFGIEKNKHVGDPKRWINTCNYDCNLSQTLQYVLFSMNDTYFIIVETHNGCDLRCGYSDGMVYEIKDIYSYFGSEFIEYCTDESYFDSIQNEWTFDSDKKAFFTSDGEEVRIYGGGI